MYICIYIYGLKMCIKRTYFLVDTLEILEK